MEKIQEYGKIKVLGAKQKQMRKIIFREGMEKRKRGIRVGKKEVTLYSMAFANISVNKRRTVTTIITMGLSCVLFITLANYTENIDVEYEARRVVEFGQFKLSLEYYLDDEGYPKNNLDYLVDNDPISEDLVETISSIKGVTDVKLQGILSVTENGEKADMAVLNREQFNHLVNERGMGELDYDKVTEEGGIVRGYAHFLESEGYRLNEPLDVSIKTRSKTVNFNTRIVGAFATGNTEWFITEDSFKKLKLDAEGYGQLWVNCNSKEVDQVEKKINFYFKQKCKERIHCGPYSLSRIVIVKLFSYGANIGFEKNVIVCYDIYQSLYYAPFCN